MLKNLLKRRITPASGPSSAPLTDVTAPAGMDYGAQKKLLAASDLAARLRLAAAADTRPEILLSKASP
jgi:hypothetical protein